MTPEKLLESGKQYIGQKNKLKEEMCLKKSPYFSPKLDFKGRAKMKPEKEFMVVEIGTTGTTLVDTVSAWNERGATKKFIQEHPSKEYERDFVVVESKYAVMTKTDIEVEVV